MCEACGTLLAKDAISKILQLEAELLQKVRGGFNVCMRSMVDIVQHIRNTPLNESKSLNSVGDPKSFEGLSHSLCVV